MAEFNPHAVTITQAVEIVRNIIVPRAGAVVIEGPPGASKTSQLNQMIRELQESNPDFGGCSTNASNMQSVDLFGWPMASNSPLSQNGVPMIFQPNAELGMRGAYPILNSLSPDKWYDGKSLTTTMLTPFREGVFMLDDVGKVADETVFASIAQLAEEGRTGQWGISTSGWARVFITNAVEHMSHDHAFPAHTRNRVLFLKTYCAYEDVAPYWRSCGMHEHFLAFAAAESKLVLSSTVPLGQQQFCTARSWFNAWQDATVYCQMMAGVPDANADDPDAPYVPVSFPVVGIDDQDEGKIVASQLFMSFIAGRCGDGVADSFRDFLMNMNQRPTMEEILKDPAKARIPQHAAVVYSTAEMCATHGTLADIDKLCAYMMRLPKPVSSVWCARMAEKWHVHLVRNTAYNMLVIHCGAAARIGMFRNKVA